MNSLSDDKYGSITSAHAADSTFGQVVSTTCSTPQSIPAGASNNYSCSFVGRMTSCDQTLTDIVTATATDDDGTSYTKTGTATVVVATTP